MQETKRVSLKLDSRLSERIKFVQRAEKRPHWSEQAEWFLEVRCLLAEKEPRLRPVPKNLPSDLEQNDYQKLDLPKRLVKLLEKIAQKECLTLVEVIRQSLWIGARYWLEMRLPGASKEVFVEYIAKDLTKLLGRVR